MARPPKFDDDEIIGRAMHAFWTRGVTAVSIRDLESELELRAPSIYRRFGSKEGLAEAVVDRYVADVIEGRIARHLPGTGDPVANLTGFLVSAVSPGPAGEPLIGCLLTTVAIEGDSGQAMLWAAVQRGLDRIEDAMRLEVCRADALGRLADGVDVEAAVGTLALVMQGLMASARAGVPATRLRRRAKAALSAVTA